MAPGRRTRRSGTASLLLLAVVGLVLVIALLACSCAEAKKKKRSHQKSAAEIQLSSTGLRYQTDERGNTFSHDMTAAQFLQQHDSFKYNASISSVRHFEGQVLGYVTPWNNHGYEVAKMFAPKFTHISPVWFQIMPFEYKKNMFHIEGEHNVDRQWMDAVRASAAMGHLSRDSNNTDDAETMGGVVTQSPKIRIVPRFALERWDRGSYEAFFGPEISFQENVAKRIGEICQKHNFDGLVLEWGYMKVKPILASVLRFLALLQLELTAHDMQLILVVPPLKNLDSPLFSADDMRQISPYVHGFSLMTYDFSSAEIPGPNSPLEWDRMCVQSLLSHPQNTPNKIFMGLNMYGTDFTLRAGQLSHVVGNQVVDLLRQHHKSVLSWDLASREHYFEYIDENKKVHKVWYPTLHSMSDRIALASELGVSLSLWEIGQGLDFMFTAL